MLMLKTGYYDILTRHSAAKITGDVIDVRGSLLVASAFDELLQRNPDSTVIVSERQRDNIEMILDSIQERDNVSDFKPHYAKIEYRD